MTFKNWGKMTRVCAPIVRKAQLRGKTIAIDMGSIIYLACLRYSTSLYDGAFTSGPYYVVIDLLRNLLDAGCRLIVVVDGDERPVEKRACCEERRAKTNAACDALAAALRAGREPTKEEYDAALRIPSWLWIRLRDWCRSQVDVAFVVAPQEADAQAAYLVRAGYADHELTPDGDAVCFGTPSILRPVGGDQLFASILRVSFEHVELEALFDGGHPVSVGGAADRAAQSFMKNGYRVSSALQRDLVTFEDWSVRDLRWLCVLCGHCDYVRVLFGDRLRSAVPGVGVVRGYHLVLAMKTLLAGAGQAMEDDADDDDAWSSAGEGDSSDDDDFDEVFASNHFGAVSESLGRGGLGAGVDSVLRRLDARAVAKGAEAGAYEAAARRAHKVFAEQLVFKVTGGDLFSGTARFELLPLETAVDSRSTGAAMCISVHIPDALAAVATQVARGDLMSSPPYGPVPAPTTPDPRDRAPGADLNFERWPPRQRSPEVLRDWLVARGFFLPSGTKKADICAMVERMLLFPDDHPCRKTIPVDHIRNCDDWEHAIEFEQSPTMPVGIFKGPEAFERLQGELEISVELVERAFLPPVKHDPQRWGRALTHFDGHSFDPASFSLRYAVDARSGAEYILVSGTVRASYTAAVAHKVTLVFDGETGALRAHPYSHCSCAIGMSGCSHVLAVGLVLSTFATISTWTEVLAQFPVGVLDVGRPTTVTSFARAYAERQREERSRRAELGEVPRGRDLSSRGRADASRFVSRTRDEAAARMRGGRGRQPDLLQRAQELDRDAPAPTARVDGATQGRLIAGLAAHADVRGTNIGIYADRYMRRVAPELLAEGELRLAQPMAFRGFTTRAPGTPFSSRANEPGSVGGASTAARAPAPAPARPRRGPPVPNFGRRSASVPAPTAAPATRRASSLPPRPRRGPPAGPAPTPAPARRAPRIAAPRSRAPAAAPAPAAASRGRRAARDVDAPRRRARAPSRSEQPAPRSRASRGARPAREARARGAASQPPAGEAPPPPPPRRSRSVDQAGGDSDLEIPAFGPDGQENNPVRGIGPVAEASVHLVRVKTSIWKGGDERLCGVAIALLRRRAGRRLLDGAAPFQPRRLVSFPERTTDDETFHQSLIRDLTEEELNSLTLARRRSPRAELGHDASDDPILMESVARLMDNRWLDQGAINCRLRAMAARHPEVRVLDTSDYAKLRRNISDAFRDRYWAKEWTRCIMPINDGECHWCAVFIDCATYTIECFDPYGDTHRDHGLVAQAFVARSLRARADALSLHTANLAPWQVNHKPSGPRQPRTNGSDCGIYMLDWALCRIEGRVPLMTEADIPRARRRFAADILRDVGFNPET